MIYVVAALYAWSLTQGPWAPALVPLVVFGAIPLLDQWIGPDPTESNPDPRLDGWLRVWVPVQLGLLAVSLWVARDLAPGPAALLAVCLGIVTGAGGINVAHELVHRADKRDRALGEVLLVSVTYTWFAVEHVLGHHRWVATPKDPATARRGETVYGFVPRSIVGGLRSFWNIERDLTERRGIPWWSLRDRRTRYALTLVVVYAALASWGGLPAVLFFAGQSLVAVCLLEIINYVEHYGLSRAQTQDAAGHGGEYERVSPHHSWNSNHWLTGAFLFNLPRHADHHAYAARPFHALRAWTGAPELPFGYATMVLVALVPPVWFALMDRRVDALATASAR